MVVMWFGSQDLIMVVCHNAVQVASCSCLVDRWEGSQKHNSYDIERMYILKS